MTSTIAVRVTRKTQEAEDIFSFELCSEDGEELPAFSAGAHIDVHVSGRLIRQYSLCNAPTERHRYLIAVLREPESRGGSLALHDTIREGDVIRISPPRNLFPLVPARRSLLFAGGIGVTPILCMAEQLALQGASFAMHYCTRSEARTAFRDRIRSSAFAERAHFHFDDGDPAQKLDLSSALDAPEQDTHIYVCGPAGFIEYIRNAARAKGWRDEQVHFEYFAAAPADHPDGNAFDVKLASSGKVYSIPPDRSVIQVLEENGVFLPVSCEQGICGTCITRVLDGIPDHRDMYLTDEEHARNDQFTPCCSRARSRMLVLDL